MQRLLRILSTALITAGVVVIVDVGLTLAWQEPVSSVYGSLQQRGAANDLDELAERFPDPADLEAAAAVADPARRASLLADRFAAEIRRGDAIGRLRIDRIDLDAVVVEGTDTDTLRKGPAHYMREDAIGAPGAGDGSALPGQGKTIGVAGHRTTYLAPFRDIDAIRDGDEIRLEMPYGTFTYVVAGHDIVAPDDVSVIADVGGEQLVLTACHPLYSAAERYVVYADLEDISFFAAADRVWQAP